MHHVLKVLFMNFSIRMFLKEIFIMLQWKKAIIISGKNLQIFGVISGCTLSTWSLLIVVWLAMKSRSSSDNIGLPFTHLIFPDKMEPSCNWNETRGHFVNKSIFLHSDWHYKRIFKFQIIHRHGILKLNQSFIWIPSHVPR